MARADLKRIQVTASSITYARLVKQADEVGLSVASYATQLLARQAKAEELASAHMPEIYKTFGASLGSEVVHLADEVDSIE